jgi:hypothetical protein
MSKFAWIAIIGLFFSQTSFAKEQKVSQAKLKNLVSEYYFSKNTKELFSQPSILDECKPIPKKGSCITAACSRMANYYCDERSELKEISDACANNIDGTCLTTFCNKLSSYNCDEPAEIKEVARICGGPVDGQCIDNVCKRMPNYYCDETSEVRAVATACTGLVDADCINVVCNKLASYYCDEFSELKEVIEMCKNP